MQREENAYWMRQALLEAEKAFTEGEIAVGAVVVKDGKEIARAHNTREATLDPSAHAEVNALRLAALLLQDRFVTHCTLFVTLEPCPMCAGLLSLLRLKSLVFGAYDPKMGCAGSYYDLVGDGAFGPVLSTTGGVMEKECAEILQKSLQNVRGKG